jgi:methylthioribose-1-phosphate isomerase
MKFKTIEWRGNRVRILDQRRLPQEVRYLDCKEASEVAKAIRSMAIRGAPAIGVAAALGIALGAKKIQAKGPEAFRKAVGKVCEEMAKTRPTAINLFWAIDRMKGILEGSASLDIEEMRTRLEEEASRILEEDVEINRRIGENGKGLIHEGDRVLTHCNAGALATAGHGTALGVIQSAWEEGKRFHVFVDETRPLFQGARLTAWELSQEKIPFTLLTDSMAGWLMKNGEVSLVLVGADRICRNGDTANKIGTYSLAVLAHYHKIPFYVAAPTSTLDSSLSCGVDVPIEERSPEEVTHPGGKRVAPRGARVRNPSFDVTPHSLIRAIITEKKVVRNPFSKELKRIVSG